MYKTVLTVLNAKPLTKKICETFQMKANVKFLQAVFNAIASNAKNRKNFRDAIEK
jgi:hypothetical protein